MASEKKKTKQPAKQPTGYRLRRAFEPLAKGLAERRGYTVTDLVNEAVRKELEAAGLWPLSKETQEGK